MASSNGSQSKGATYKDMNHPSLNTGEETSKRYRFCILPESILYETDSPSNRFLDCLRETHGTVIHTTDTERVFTLKVDLLPDMSCDNHQLNEIEISRLLKYGVYNPENRKVKCCQYDTGKNTMFLCDVNFVGLYQTRKNFTFRLPPVFFNRKITDPQFILDENNQIRLVEFTVHQSI